MKILSLHVGHNATAAIMEDGRIVGVLSQEKLDNIKNSAAFPSDATMALLKQVGWSRDDIDNIVVAGNTIDPPECYESIFNTKRWMRNTSAWTAIFKRFARGVVRPLAPGVFHSLRKCWQRRFAEQGMKYLKRELIRLGLEGKPISFVEHHLCHARAAYHAMNREGDGQESLIFTLDGSGDDLCATVSKVDRNGHIERLGKTPYPYSLGLVYSSTTLFLGMNILADEHKVMGLAAYAKESFKDTYQSIFKDVIRIDEHNPLQFTGSLDSSEFYNYLARYAVGERFDNIAAAVQYLIEEQVEAWIRAAIDRTGIRRVFMGGGVFMNVKLNKRIQEMKEIDQVFFMPSCGDESTTIGAAYDVAATRGYSVEPLHNLYLGISYGEDEIERFIADKNIDERFRVNKSDLIEEDIAALLAEREVVARFSGRCEWGARSLGNRAILAHPSYMESFYAVNDQVKCRDFWMPFAPSILDTWASKYLKGYDPKKVEAAYMITTHDATELAVKHLRAAIHQSDHSIRVQVVNEHSNDSYYQLLQAFEKKTGVGGVLNTSLNLHGYPLAATLEQALATFENSGLQYLALGSFLISKYK